MPQTLGAFLAMLVVMMFAINFQHSSLTTQRRVLSSEVDVIANAVASEAMQYIAAKPFDDAIGSGALTPANANRSLLTPGTSFGGDKAYADAADLDDFHGLVHTVTFEMTSDSELTFNVTFDVKYVDDLGQPSTSPTWTKEATVIVDGPGIMLSPVKLTRQFSPLWY